MRPPGRPAASPAPAALAAVGFDFVWARVAVAVVLFVVGVIWIGQGIGIIGGSFMTGQALWAIIGAIAVLAALTLLRGAVRDRRLHRDED